MSQEQPRRDQYHDDDQKPIKYGDVFAVEGELVEKPVAPGDAAIMQSAENIMLGKTEKGVAAATMQSAASRKERTRLVGHYDVNIDLGGGGDNDQGISMTETNIPGQRIITEAVGGQVVGQYSQRAPLVPPPTIQGDGITIGEALEATALSAGQKPVERSDAAAIQAAEVRATGRINIVPGSVATAAQSAATQNAGTTRSEDKAKLRDVLEDATSKLSADRPATRRDAEGVTSAEMRNDMLLTRHPTGVAASVAIAARLNEKGDKSPYNN